MVVTGTEGFILRRKKGKFTAKPPARAIVVDHDIVLSLEWSFRRNNQLVAGREAGC